MKDSVGQAVKRGDTVIALNSANGVEFRGTITDIKTDADGSLYAEVTDQDDSCFCCSSSEITHE